MGGPLSRGRRQDVGTPAAAPQPQLDGLLERDQRGQLHLRQLQQPEPGGRGPGRHELEPAAGLRRQRGEQLPGDQLRRRGQRRRDQPDRLRGEQRLQGPGLHRERQPELGEGQAQLQVRRRVPAHGQPGVDEHRGPRLQLQPPDDRGDRDALVQPGGLRLCQLPAGRGRQRQPGDGRRDARPAELRRALRPGRLEGQRQADPQLRAALGADRPVDGEERQLGQLQHLAAEPHHRDPRSARVRQGRQHVLRGGPRLVAVRAAGRPHLLAHAEARRPRRLRDLLPAHRDGLLVRRPLQLRPGLPRRPTGSSRSAAASPLSTGTAATRASRSRASRTPTSPSGAW